MILNCGSEGVKLVCDMFFYLKIGSNMVALGLNKEDLGSYSRLGHAQIILPFY